jgi:hypothetical protein
MVGKHLQNKPQRLISRVQVKASSTKGRDLVRAQPRARTVDPDGFTPRPRASSGSGCTLGSPKAQLGQTLSCSDLDQIALPTDRIACAFNAEIAWHLILTRAPQSARSKWPQSLCPLYWPFWQENNTVHPAPDTVPTTRERLTTVSHGLSRVQPRAQQGAPPRPTPGLDLSLGLGRRSPPRLTPGLNRHLGLRKRSPPRPTSASASGGVTASPDLGLGPTTL